MIFNRTREAYMGIMAYASRYNVQLGLVTDKVTWSYCTRSCKDT